MSWLRSLFELVFDRVFPGLSAESAALERLAPWREAHRRTAWKPRTVDEDGPASASKFAGTPWLAAGERWPACETCGRPMPLFLQLDLDAAAGDTGEPLGDGLLQIFYCTGDDCGAEGWAPFQGGKLVRVVRGPLPGAAGLPGVPPARLPSLPVRRIVGFDPLPDLPHAEEHGELGLAYAWDFEAKRLTVTWPERSLTVETPDLDLPEKLAAAASGDKLLGWPCWVQGVEYPSCPRCGKRMAFLFQLDSEDHVPFMFGDAGCGHVTRCPDHPDIVAFGWACS